MTTLRILFCMCLACVSAARGAHSSLAEDPAIASGIHLLEAWIESQMAYRDLPGMSVAIVFDQDVVWARGFGYADREQRKPATTETIYRIASNSKVFTSIAVMKLREEGKLDLDDPVDKHLSWFKIRNKYPDAPPITIRHLLTHSSGLPREAAFPYWTDFEFPTREQMIARLPEQETVYPSETKWKYSNLGLALAGEIVAAASGMSYADYVQKNILEPLGMNSTSVFLPDSHRARLAVGYGRRMPDGSREIMPFTDCQAIAPAGNLSSTADDLARFVSWQMRLRESEAAEILRPSTLRDMQRVHWLREDWKSGTGLGFQIVHGDSRDVVGHGGWVGGYQTGIFISPVEKVGVIVLSNADDTWPYPGHPLSVVDRAFAWVAPAIVKALQPPGEPAPAPRKWDQYVGLYRERWGDSQVLIRDDKLVLVNPFSMDPTVSLMTLAPVAEHTFRMEGEGYGEHGELLVFEMGPDGRVARVRLGENYMTPVR